MQRKSKIFVTKETQGISVDLKQSFKHLKTEFSNKKQIVLIAVLLIFASSFVSASLVISTGDSGISSSARLEFANATELDKYNVNYNLVNQIPDPAEPGKYVDLRWKIENFGSDDAEDVIVELLPEYPFSLDPGVSTQQKIGKVWGRQIGEEGVIVYYKVRVDKNAIEGDNKIKLRYSLTGGKYWIVLDPFNVRIQSQDPILAIDDVISTPTSIKPGETATVIVKLRNLAGAYLKDIKVKFDLTDVDFAPIGSANEKTIRNIEADAVEEVEFKLMANPDADSGLVKVPLTVDYLDSSGDSHSKENTLGLVIGGEPDLMTAIDSTEIKTSGETGNIIVKFTNKGLTDVKLLNIVLKETNDFSIVSNDQEYIGNIDSDDYETAEFKLNVKKTEKEIIDIPVEFEYMDANNNGYKERVNLELKLYSKKEAQKLGLEEKSNVLGIVIVIVIVGAGLFFYIRYRKKKSAK